MKYDLLNTKIIYANNYEYKGKELSDIFFLSNKYTE